MHLTHLGEPLTATRKDRYNAMIFSTPGMGGSAFCCANHRDFCKCQQPPGVKIHTFFRWKMPFAVFRSGSGVSDHSLVTTQVRDRIRDCAASHVPFQTVLNTPHEPLQKKRTIRLPFSQAVAKTRVLFRNREWGVSGSGVSQWLASCIFLARKSAIAREFLLELDFLLAFTEDDFPIARAPHPEHQPFKFPNSLKSKRLFCEFPALKPQALRSG